MTKGGTALIILTVITAVCWVGWKTVLLPKQPQDMFIGKAVEAISPVLQTSALEEMK